MADTGVKYPTTAVTASVNPEDDIDWTNPTNVGADDGAYATALVPAATGITLRLLAQGFDFSAIPAGSTIDGILVEIERKAVSYNNSLKDYRVQLLDANGALVGDNKADTSTFYPQSYVKASYGGATDTWNASPTLAMVQDADFGVAFSVANSYASRGDTASVDYIRITVYYTGADGGAAIRGWWSK